MQWRCHRCIHAAGELAAAHIPAYGTQCLGRHGIIAEDRCEHRLAHTGTAVASCVLIDIVRDDLHVGVVVLEITPAHHTRAAVH